VAWTRSNTAEAMPAVPTPLSWTFWYRALELGARGMYADLGVWPRSEVRLPAEVDERLVAIFYGRPAANVDAARRVGDAMPGTSGDAVEEQLFGTTRPGIASRPRWRRYPIVMVRAPWQLLRGGSRLARLRTETHRWWRDTTARLAARNTSIDIARLAFPEAIRRYEQQMRASNVLFSQLTFDLVRRLAQEVGLAGAEARLVSGYGSMEEGRMLTDLWEVSRGRLGLDRFAAEHGFHGPNEGELSSHSWREDPSPLEVLADRYRELVEDASPAARAREQTVTRESAERELLARFGPVGRIRARACLAAARRYVPHREVAKTTYLEILDVARACARRLGEEVAGRGALDDPQDVFYLTAEELCAAPGGGFREQVAFRRSRRDHYLTLSLPETWTGMPEFVALEPSELEGSVLRGVPVAPGVVEGLVRVVLDPSATEELEPGEILVCHTTDPSWASLFPIVGAAVIDIGGPLSHGAIVARELGLPCVINTKTGTRALRTGDRVRVDGTRGVVERLEPSRPPSRVNAL